MPNLNWISFKTKFIPFITNIWVLGLFLSLGLSLFLPNFFNKYAVKLVEEVDRVESKKLTFFEDFNKDGYKEKLSILNNRNRFASCLLQNNDGTTIEQFNFYGNLPNQENLNTPIFNDVTNDGSKELFVFTQKADSLFINAIDFSANKVIVYGKFVSILGMNKEFKDFVLRPIINHDYNSDGTKEMYFLLNGGYSLYPRKLMAYDYKNDTIISSINTGSQHYVKPVEIENELRFISTTKGTHNCDEKFPFRYPDNVSRLFGFNDRLELIFEPLEFKGVSCSVNGPIIYNNELHFNLLDCGETDSKNYLISVNNKGKILNKKEFKQTIQKKRGQKIVYDYKEHFLFNSVENGLFSNYEYKPSLMLFEQNSFTRKLPKGAMYPFNFSKNEIGNMWVDYTTKKASLLLDNLTQKVDFDNEFYLKEWNLYVQTKKILQGKIIMLTNKKRLYTYLLSDNVYYSTRYILYLLLYLLSVGIIYLPRRRRLLHASKRKKLQKEISVLQLQLVNAQLNPHFTFNALNTVSAKILKEERFEAYDLMTSFSNMMRSVMLNSDKNDWKLQEELNFSKDYLLLMQSRFKNVFKFSFEIDSNISIENVVIPRLLIQNFIENIVKHAFKGVSYEGCINIKIKEYNNILEIQISDNGIGREKALLNSKNDPNKSGKGIGLNKKQLEIYNKLYNTNISFEILDLGSSIESSGTRVFIKIPFEKE